MFRKPFLILLALCLCAPALTGTAAEVSSDSVYCFTDTDFSGDSLAGVCITALPAPETGTVLLGTRILQPGDILTAGQLAQLTFCPVRTEQDTTATLGYLPIYDDRVEQETELTLSILGKKDKAPKAGDVQLETYKNIPNEGKLKATDPEGQSLTYTVIRQPRRGNVVIAADGSFTYTPKKNKVGVDSFTYTAADPAGNVSKEATVTIKILKPAESTLYQDTAGLDCRFEAEWLKNTGLFTGEQIGGKQCFQPEKTVSKGEFTAMLLESLGAPLEQETGFMEFAEKAPEWLKPYLAAALRSGLLTGVSQTDGFDAPITGLDAAVMLQNALDLTAAQTMAGQSLDSAQLALAVMNENGFTLSAEEPLTRADCAKLLYRLSITDAPGKAVFYSEKE